MNKEKLSYYSSLIFCILGAGVIFFIFMRYIFSGVLPFLIAWAVAFAVRRPAAWLHRKTKLPTGPCRVVLSVLGIIAVVGVGFGMIWRGALLIGELLSGLDTEQLGALIDSLGDIRLGIFGELIPEELTGEIAAAFKNVISSLLASLASGITRWIAAIPRALLSIVIALIATIYFALDLERINAAVRRLLPKRIVGVATRIKNGFLSVGVRYLRAYALIMLITFGIMLTGLSLLRVRHAPLLALVIAALDILPVLGVGTVLVPWSVLSLVSGNTFLGIGLIILLCVNVIIRQISEPRIVGKNLDLHPVLTLMLLYLGYTLFGFVGLVLLPFTAVLVNIIVVKNEPTEVG